MVRLPLSRSCKTSGAPSLQSKTSYKQPVSNHPTISNPLPANEPTVSSPAAPILLNATPMEDLMNGWGDTPPVIDEFTTMRIVYQNVNGLNLKSPSTQFLFGNLQAMQCGVFLAAETNVNWRNRSVVDSYKTLVHKVWPSHRLVYASSSVGNDRKHRNSAYLPGGVAIWVNNF